MPSYLFYPLAMFFMRLSSLFFLGLLALLPTKAHADLQQEMDAMFGTMTNATSPTAHLGQRRGVISAGSVVSHNRVMSANMVSFVPPSFSAGCGGIDLFGGSFSFINMNQFVDLMRAVASNAAGYAFQLAINAMCPDCGNVMSDLQKKVRQLNQMFSNSCQLAQGLVNDAASVLPDKVQSDMKMSTISFSKGVTDVFGALTNTSAQGDPVQQVKANAPADMQQAIQGNLVWRAINKNNAGGLVQIRRQRLFTGGNERHRFGDRQAARICAGRQGRKQPGRYPAQPAAD